MTAVVDNDDKLVGIFTDGDLRRVLAQEVNILTAPLQEHMTQHCKTGQSEMLAAEALQMMQQYKINGLLITDDNHNLTGALNMHDLLRAGVV
jgi:arabinose-5-phosphate isomerase